MIIYLDENCYQRGFDDQSHPLIKMETVACQEIIRRAELGDLDLVWSFMLLDETHQCPFPERKKAILDLSEICKIRVRPDDDIYRQSHELLKRYHLSPKDAIHLACALSVHSDVFLTCDNKIVKKVKSLEKMAIMNPIDYIKEEV